MKRHIETSRLLLAFLLTAGMARAELKVGDAPPPLQLSGSVQGPPANQITWDRLRGKVIVLEFWATWCGPCVRAIPHLNGLADQFKDKPVQFVAVTAENPGVLETFLKRQPMRAWVALDDYETMKSAFGVTAIPQTVIVSASGRIAAITHPALLQAAHLDEVLAGKPCTVTPLKWREGRPEEVETQPNVRPVLFEISIRPSGRKDNGHGASSLWSEEPDDSGFTGEIATVESALIAVFRTSPTRLRIRTSLPEELFDFRLKVPAGQSALLESQFRQALRGTFGLEVRRTREVVGAYRLRVFSAHAPGLLATEKPGGGGGTAGGFRVSGASMATIRSYLEEALGRPVLDDSGLKGLFNVDMKWEMSEMELLPQKLDPRVLQVLEEYPKTDRIQKLPAELRVGEAGRLLDAMLAELKKPVREQFRPNPASIQKAARERLGLELVPVREDLEVLEIQAAPPR